MATPGSGRESPQYVIFTMQGATCDLPAEAVLGIERITSVALVPNTASWVLGVAQVLGGIVSAVDLAAFLGLAPAQLSPRSRLIVVSRGPMTVGLVVDGVEMGTTSARPVSGKGIMHEWARPFARGMLDVAGTAIILFDPDKLLVSERMKQYRV